MSQSISRAVKLFGTDVPASPVRHLRAGPLTAELSDGNLRYIRIAGVEALRGIAFVVRDAFWGTYNPDISELSVSEAGDGFEVSYAASCKDAKQQIRYRAKIVGDAEGNLHFEAALEPVSDFSSNRVGFVVLHPLAGVVGHAVEILHVDGSKEQSSFPHLVEPWQPFENIRAMTHEVSPGVKITCRMEGDAFETEDHRNWTDASYKTYVRPLAAPAPFTMKAGERSAQSVSLRSTGVSMPAPTPAPAPTTVRVGTRSGHMPRIGLGVHPRRAAAALDVIELVKALSPQVLVCHFDPRDGHAVADLKRFRALAEATRSDLVLELVVPCEDDYVAELDAVGADVAQAGARFSAVTVVPGPDLIAGRPFSDFPNVPPLENLYAAARAVFTGAAIGGGTCSYFTELNRRRPPMAYLDYLTHVTCAIVHAADDVSVTETLEALPFVIRTADAIRDGKPYRVGPSAIGSRHAPFGGAVTANPDNQRVTMTRTDPRQRSLLGAAWNLGLAARLCAAVEVLSLSAPVGEFGLIYQQMDWPQPGFDGGAGAVYPAYPIVAGLAGAAADARLDVDCSSPRAVQALAHVHNGKTALWIANLTGDVQAVDVEGMDVSQSKLWLMDEDTFEQCIAGPDGFASTERNASSHLELKPYAVARIA